MTKVVLFFQAATLRSKAWRDKIAGVFKYGAKRQWQVQMVQSDASVEEIRYMLEVWKPIGCIVDRSTSDARNPTALFHDIPIVLMDQNPDTMVKGYACVNHDSSATATLAAEELLRTDVAHFSYVPHKLNTHWNRQRQLAMSTTVKTAGRHYVDWGDNPFSDRWTTAEQDERIARRLREMPRPLGLLCANDQIAERIIRVAVKTGIDIPRDLVLIGIDNDELICEHTRPTLSSVLPDFESGGYIAARLLDKVIKTPATPPVTVSYGPLDLVRRQSTRGFAYQDAFVNRAMDMIATKAFEPDFHTAHLVEALACSRSLLEMRFRKEIGCTIREEIQKIRLEKALALLKSPHQSITAIPSLCGYVSEAFFKRLFKKHTGLTMREWRRRNVTPPF